MHFANLVILITSLCLGIRTISDTGKLLEPLRNFIAKYFPEWISKPTILCCACMASFWGTIVFTYFHYKLIILHYADKEIVIPLVLKWIGACIIASFLNELCWSIIILIRAKIDYYKSNLKSLR